VRCPNMADGGWCAPGEHCCEQSSASGMKSQCASTCAGTDAEADWACQDPSQCGTGEMCCGRGGPVDDPLCGFVIVRHFTGTSCAASCRPTEFVACERSSECPGGQICKAARARGGAIGVCLP
jgi:hypothetical protein